MTHKKTSRKRTEGKKGFAKSGESTSGDAVVLVGTYKERQLDWIVKNGIYNYPIFDDEPELEFRAQIKELWLYADAKATRHCFMAEFMGILSREEFLAAYPTYKKLGSCRHRRYMVFKTQVLDYGPSFDTGKLVARMRDFTHGRSQKIAKAIEQFKAGGTLGSLADFLPAELAKLPSEQLRVCESATQLEFSWNIPVVRQKEENGVVPFASDFIRIEFGDSYSLCQKWLPPTVIISDGPYGLKSYPGDPPTPDGLADFYRPFLRRWYDLSLPSATLWFWNSEQGWANCHREIEANGWEFRNCHIWNKGMAHVAGNCNTKTIRKYPVVTEVCAQYVRKNSLISQGVSLPLKDWMREEWKRTNLPFRLTNIACGVKDAATRKYFATDHLWYFPPSEAFVKIAAYANLHGDVSGRPYFSKSDGTPFSAEEWDLMRAKFHCEIGVSNVWDLPAVRGSERIRNGTACLHMNQKPLELLERIIRSSSDEGDVVWEPFGGLCSTAIAAYRTRRQSFSAEINPLFFKSAQERLEHEKRQ